MTLSLYATEGCHLCEEAMELLEALSLSVRYIDIADDDDLSARYGMRIPVLRRDDGAELDWPFAEAEIRRFHGQTTPISISSSSKAKSTPTWQSG